MNTNRNTFRSLLRSMDKAEIIALSFFVIGMVTLAVIMVVGLIDSGDSGMDCTMVRSGSITTCV